MNVRNSSAGMFFVSIIVALGMAGLGIFWAIRQKPKDVLRVSRADPELQAAVRQARDGLDAFIKELGHPKADERFAVKGDFQTNAGPEYLWVRKPAFKGGRFSGELDQQPMALAGKKKGDHVVFAKKDAVDWLIKDATGTRGEFTEKVLEKRNAG